MKHVAVQLFGGVQLAGGNTPLNRNPISFVTHGVFTPPNCTPVNTVTIVSVANCFKFPTVSHV